MGQSIGELFVKLGFDVDDSKLTSFSDSIDGLYSGIQRLGALVGVGAGAGAFVSLAKQASDTAITVENLTKVYGVSEQAVRSWAAAVSENNPLKSFNDGVSSFATMSKYIYNASKGAGASALNQLGGRWSSSMIGHTELLSDELFRIVPAMLKAHPNMRARYADLIGDITGDPANIGVFERGKTWADAAANKARTSDLDNNKMAEERRHISGLSNEWDSFINHVMGTLAGRGLRFESIGEKHGWWSATADAVGDAFRGVGSWMGGRIAGSPMSTMTNNMMNGGRGPLGLRSHNPGNLQPGGIESIFPDDATGLLAMAQNLHRYGTKGWDTVDSIVDHWAPASGSGNSAASAAAYKANLRKIFGNQRLNLNDPQTLKRLMGPMISQEQGRNPFSDQQLGQAANGAVTVNVTQNIHSNDPDVAGRVAAQSIQDTITRTTLNRMPEPY